MKVLQVIDNYFFKLDEGEYAEGAKWFYIPITVTLAISLFTMVTA